jgi:hypothetical protein
MKNYTMFLIVLGIIALLFTFLFVRIFVTPTTSPDANQPAVTGHRTDGVVMLNVVGNAGRVELEVKEGGKNG